MWRVRHLLAGGFTHFYDFRHCIKMGCWYPLAQCAHICWGEPSNMANMALNLSWHGRIPIETSTTVSGGDSLVKHLADEWPCNFKQAVPGFVWNSLIWNRCPMMSFTPVGWLKMMGNTQFGRTNRTFFWATYLPHNSSMPLRWLCGYFKRSR